METALLILFLAVFFQMCKLEQRVDELEHDVDELLDEFEPDEEELDEEPVAPRDIKE